MTYATLGLLDARPRTGWDKGEGGHARDTAKNRRTCFGAGNVRQKPTQSNLADLKRVGRYLHNHRCLVNVYNRQSWPGK
eukprot:6126335-Amphidinium_carterae.1